MGITVSVPNDPSRSASVDNSQMMVIGTAGR